MFDTELELDMEALESAEDFLEYFGIEYDSAVVQVNRLHILQRFHDYLSAGGLPAEEDLRRELYRELLQSAYEDFVKSNALTEKVFNVFKVQKNQIFVPLSSLLIQR
ncbi:MAG TPA: nitrogen fixation protein NifW [Gammaproteobacteria bacterium]|nr:nitrogen fixation protein NifW [Gammaproteobacteria bacterium]